MSYVGGKSRGADHILRVLNDPVFDGTPYWEPFIGYAHLLRRVRNKASYRASDAEPLLITLLLAVQRGDALPSVDRERYAALRSAPGVSLERAVAAFQYSFNGKKWGGYVCAYTRADGRVDDIPGSRARYYERLRAAPAFARATLVCEDYRAHRPAEPTLIMCDPPYGGALGYGTPFDHDAFWAQAARWSDEGHAVLVAEYEAPAPWVEVGWSAKACCVAGGHRQVRRVERLFALPSTLSRFKIAAVDPQGARSRAPMLPTG